MEFERDYEREWEMGFSDASYAEILRNPEFHRAACLEHLNHVTGPMRMWCQYTVQITNGLLEEEDGID